jgi:hypothetical protein
MRRRINASHWLNILYLPYITHAIYTHIYSIDNTPHTKYAPHYSCVAFLAGACHWAGIHDPAGLAHVLGLQSISGFGVSVVC